MAKPKKIKAQVVDSWKKKRWHRILAPKIFNEQVIGETPALEPNMLSGRTINVNLMNLTRDMKKQHMNLIFEVDRIMGDTVFTRVRSFSINPSSIKRFVRRGKDRIDDSFLCMSADDYQTRVKPFIITRSSVNKNTQSEIRKKARQLLSARIKKTNSENLINDIVYNRLQKEIRDSLKKIYPLKIFDVRVISFEKAAKGSQQEAEVKADAAVAEKTETKEENKEVTKTEENAEKKAKPAVKKTEKKKAEETKEKAEETEQESKEDSDAEKEE